MLVLGAFVKGAVAFGFPLVTTPLLSLVVGVQTAIPLLIVPNIVYDVLQLRYHGGFARVARRLGVLMLCAMIGTLAGTRLLTSLSGRAATLTLGVFLLIFITVNVSRFSPRVPAGGERWLSGPVGLLAGVLTGLTNATSTPLIVYFYALGMDKQEFVRAIAFSFIVVKTTQLAAVLYYDLLTPRLLLATAALTVIGLPSFYAGLWLQNRLDQQRFNRVLLAFLTLAAVWLIVRSLR
ncbi:MAG: sulfite exporter TauE/SafE family protein [Candidatus Rokubacteria bacterium]|nr:sulfite exporter TauE/SafE family protein [Candidatus Rokubacteria bacterium]